jgi:gliding motility-associated-like protein
MKISTILLLFLLYGSAYAQQALENTWTPDNRVNDMTFGDGKIFLAGNFTWFGEPYNSSVAVFNTSLSHDTGYPVVAGPITNSIPDGADGWFVTSNYKITHIKADKTIEELPFEFGTSGTGIGGIDKVGNTLYVVGYFTSVSGTPRSYGAAIDLTNNTLTSWDPNSGGYIYCIKAVGSVIYVGGSFSLMGGLSRSKIAALDGTTGALITSWNANVITGAGYVFTIEADASIVYFGGSFSNVASGTPSRRNFAAVNTTSGALTSFNPRPDDDVLALFLDGNTLYMGGDFDQVAGVTKRQLAAVDVTTGVATSFSAAFPSPYDKDVYALAVDGDKLFVGGNFTNINHTQQANLVVLNKFSGVNEPTEDRAVSRSVLTISITGGKVLVGGSWLGITGISNSLGCIALDATTGEKTNWLPELPDVNNAFLSDLKLHYQDNRVYYLTSIYEVSDGVVDLALGALSSTDGSAIPGWSIAIDGEFAEWAFSDDAVYLAGDFTEVNGEDRDGFAAISLSTGELLPWELPITLFLGDGDNIYSLAFSNDVVYLTGEYSITDNGETRNNFSAWDATTEELLAWNPGNDPAPIGAINDGKVYLLGNEPIRVDAITGEADDWAPAVSNEGGVSDILISGSGVYYAGSFSPGLVRVDINTGAVSGTQPELYDVYDSEGSVRTLAASPNKLYAGGAFLYSTATGERRDYAEYPLNSTNSAPEITAVFQSIPVQGIISIYLPDIVTDIDNNVDLSTAEITAQPESGASAYIDGDYLIVDYSGLTFSGTDILSLRVCDTEDACGEQEITIELGGDIIVYNAISANGDEKNDRLRIQNIETFNNTKVSIFNRWGDLVFEVTGYNNEDRVFTGLNKNRKELPAGTYYYKVEFSGKTKTGYLSLKR